MPTPSVNVFWNEKKNEYLIQQQAPTTQGGSGSFGDPVILRNEDFDANVANLVFTGLENYGGNVYDPAAAISGKGWREFARQHKLVNVAKFPSGEILVSACERYGAGYGGVKNGDFKLDRAGAKEELPVVLRAAFRKAS